MGGPSNPPGKPGHLVIAFLEGQSNELLATLIEIAAQSGYSVVEQNQTSVLMERGY